MTEQGGSPLLRSVFMCLYPKGQEKQKVPKEIPQTL